MVSETPAPGQNIAIATVPNLRDVGGWQTSTGTVARGKLYRSAQFSALQGADAAAFAELGIRTVFDMRTEPERQEQPNIVPDGTNYVVIDVLKDASGAAPAQLIALLQNPKAAEEMLGDGKGVELFTGAYKQIVDLPSARSAYHDFYTALADEHILPAEYHCTTGKDRTGWGTAALLLLLGVSYDDVLTDYLLTNDQLLPTLKPVFDQFASIGGDPDLLLPVLGVQKEYLDTAEASMTAQYGDIETYFTKGLDIDEATIAKLREIYIEVA
ncbi:tyrosine-protein phosphatase [Subtercola lobariae]|uniref:Phosphatase n=1 Tax=Subtercola lobariae TaxID=1588641 RepID=A0A917B6L0_9MICO|nr:tyrosine-protein phosphatase [Subtercola lobariae]GGF27685.1 phosphatase [Subtercola lobariae]